MRYLSKKLTDYIIKVGVIQKELYAVYLSLIHILLQFIWIMDQTILFVKNVLMQVLHL